MFAPPSVIMQKLRRRGVMTQRFGWSEEQRDVLKVRRETWPGKRGGRTTAASPAGTVEYGEVPPHFYIILSPIYSHCKGESSILSFT